MFGSFGHAGLTAIKSEFGIDKVRSPPYFDQVNLTENQRSLLGFTKNCQSFYYFKAIMIPLIAVSFMCPIDPHKLLLKVVSEISWRTQNGISRQLEAMLFNIT